MSEAAALRSPTCEFLVMVLMLLAIGQAMRLFLMAVRKEERPLSLSLIYECSVFVFLMLLMMAVYSNCILSPTLHLGDASGNLLWFGILPLILGGILCIRLRHPTMILTLLSFAVVLPGVARLIPCPLPILCLVICSVFVFRTAYGLSIEIMRTRRSVSRLSMKEAVDHLPAGLLFASQMGRPLIINDRMDTFLDALGLSVNRLDTDRLWSDLESGIETGRIDGEVLGRELLVRTGHGTFLVTFETVEIARRHNGDKPVRLVEGEDAEEGHDRSSIRSLHPRRRYTCMRVVDMTHEDRLYREIEQVNVELMYTEDEIREALHGVQAVARNESLLRMRSRVHDVIGQKLSILHRFLEGGDLSDGAVARIAPLLEDLSQDLATDSQPDHPVYLDDLVSSFALIGVQLVIHGDMPRERPVAEAFSQVLREAVTNAVRHGHAQRVDVRLDSRPADFPLEPAGSSLRLCYMMTVSDDGTPPEGNIAEKTGICGMRRALADIGGTLRVDTRPAFRLTAIASAGTVSNATQNETHPAQNETLGDERTRSATPPGETSPREGNGR